MAGDESRKMILTQDRQSTFGLSMVLAGVPLCVSGLFVGGELSKGLALGKSIEAAVVGALLLTIYASLVGVIGARTGLSTTALLQEVFGHLGAKILALCLSICLCGWYAVQVDFFGQTINHLFPNGGVLTTPKVAACWGGILMMTSALFGYRGLSILSILAVPLIVALAVFGVWSSAKVNLWDIAPVGEQTFGNAVSLVVGSFAIGATVNADITRYAKNANQSLIATTTGFFVANVFILVCGAATTLSTGSGDLIASMVALGLGASALVVLILGQWTTNDNNLYYATVNMSDAFPKFNKAALAGVFGVVSTFLGVMGMTKAFVPFLVGLGLVIPPIGGIMITHYLILGKRDDLKVPPKARAIAAFTAWAAGTLTGVFLKSGIPALNSVLAAMLTFGIVTWLARCRTAK